MRRSVIASTLLILTLGVISGAAESDFAKKLKGDYSILDQDLLNHTGELATIGDFVYEKDIATFTFTEGTIHLLRYVDDRPTTALFIGKGHARINIPCHVERQSLLAIARDSVVDEEFETCLIRIGDDFDLRLRERFSFEFKQLSWRHFNRAAKKPQAEMFFKPTIHHLYDNYFQLLRSLYERGPQGYFWIDFNRYVFTFDPGRPEQVSVAYEFEGGDIVVTDGAVLQRQESGINTDAAMSDIAYPTTIINRHANIEMSGLDGKRLESAQTSIEVLVRADSLRFVSLFLDDNLKTDSIYFAQAPVDFIRRKDFRFIGIVLPEYRFRGDTLDFTLWYHGKQFDHAMPWVEDPQPSPHTYDFVTPEEYNYFMPGMGPVEEIGNRRQKFSATPDGLFDKFYYRCFTAGLDTVPVVTDVGMSLSFLNWELMSKKTSGCYIPHETYLETVAEAFNFMLARFGAPPGTFEMYVSPTSGFTMPGVMNIPHIACVTDGPMEAFGGFHAVAGRETARQWFGSLMQPATDREKWIVEAAPEYVNLLFLPAALGSKAYSNLLHRRDSVITIVERKRDLPLATGDRVPAAIRSNKGLWVFHMLRFLMYDLESASDKPFFKFLNELALLTSMKSFTNGDFIALAEKHYGQPLDRFFEHWLYGRNYPEYKVSWTTTGSGSEYSIDVEVVTKKVSPEFTMPIILRVEGIDGSSRFFRQEISGLSDSFELGPLAVEPKELVFGEFYSVLCKSKVKKK